MTEVTREEMEEKIRETYKHAFIDGIHKTSQCYDIAIRDLIAKVTQKLIESAETLFTQNPAKSEEKQEA